VGFDVRSVEPLGSITRELLTPLDNIGHKSERTPRNSCQTAGKTGVEIFTFQGIVYCDITYQISTE
jgi:hypothetical protein